MAEQTNTINNKRIAKNTLLLYMRMFITMVVTLYTSRVILQNLGVEDFGIYNVVGGVIAMFSFINDAMTTSTQRFITFALGKNDVKHLKSVFSTSFQIHVIIALVIIILGETIGLWFLMNKLVIPENRMTAAIVVYQCTVFSAVVSILCVPFNADIVAHERMSAFAYISIVEVFAKLGIVYVLSCNPWDRLIVYGVLLMAVQLIISIIYVCYCNSRFLESKPKFSLDYSLLKEMSGFAGWSCFGNFAVILYSQGLNMMLNMFFGPVVNAARGIALQVQGSVQKLVGSFQMALNPQITKNYASGQLNELYVLIYRSARFSFFVMFMIGLIIIIECRYILQLWLGDVPQNTVVFSQLMIITSLLYTIVNPCAVANQATGKVKLYQIVVGITLLFILPISYIFLYLDFPAYSVFLVHFLMECIAQIERMFLLKKNISMSIIAFCKSVYIPILTVTIISLPFPLYFHFYLNEGVLRLFTVSFFSLLSVGASSLFFGMSKNERTYIYNIILSKRKIIR